VKRWPLRPPPPLAALLSVLLSVSLLGGCAGLSRQAPPPAADGDLRLSGRLSVQVASGGDGGKKASGGNAGFELAGNPGEGQLELSTPLGSLLARASWRAGDVRLQTPEQERRFEDLDALTRELLGEAIPVAALFDWLRGRPWSLAAHQPRPQGFEQLGWQVDLARFSEGLISATRQTEPLVTLRARIEQ
jgi:outer membrane lipoprotein LolB